MHIGGVGAYPAIEDSFQSFRKVLWREAHVLQLKWSQCREGSSRVPQRTTFRRATIIPPAESCRPPRSVKEQVESHYITRPQKQGGRRIIDSYSWGRGRFCMLGWRLVRPGWLYLSMSKYGRVCWLYYLATSSLDEGKNWFAGRLSFFLFFSLSDITYPFIPSAIGHCDHPLH